MSGSACTNSTTADQLYEVSYRSSWGAGDGPLGHLVIRRLDDHEVIAEIPAADAGEAQRLIDGAEALIHGAADVFENEYGLGPDVAARPGPDVVRRSPIDASAPEPDSGERVAGEDARLDVFPDPEDVFVAEQHWLADLLHPLVSVDLSTIDHAWTGRAHVLSPVNDLTAVDSDDAATNWLLFHADDHGRLRLHGEAEHLAADAERVAAASAELAASRERWKRYGGLVWGDNTDPTRRRAGWGTDIAVIDQLGGEPGYGNWTAFAPPAGLRLDESDPTSPVLRLEDGRPFRFVAQTAAYPWRTEGADAILLFFEPETRTAALTFDWG